MNEMTLRVAACEQLTPEIRALRLVSPDGGALPGYAAGAHVRIALPDGDTRPYSLVNALAEPGATKTPSAYCLGVRLEEDSAGGSRFMHALKEGDTVTVSPPKNDFRLVESDGPALLVAGGIGVTPIISMAAELKAAGRPFHMHYCGRSRPLMAFLEEIGAVCGEALSIHCDDEAGCVLDLAGIIERAAPDTHIYVCGPRPMIEAAREIAHGRGLAHEQVHFELFDKPKKSAGDDSFEVEIKSTGEVFTIPPDKTIIEVLEEGGVDLIYDCQRGDCGICQTTVLDGVPDHRDVILTDDERAAGDVMQICVSRAKSPRLVLDL